MKLDRLILKKIIKIVATRCQILRLKCTKFDFGWGSAPDPAGEGRGEEGGREGGKGLTSCVWGGASKSLAPALAPCRLRNRSSGIAPHLGQNRNECVSNTQNQYAWLMYERRLLEKYV